MTDNNTKPEQLVALAPTLASAELARTHLMNQGMRLWLYVNKVPDGTYEVWAADQHAGSLSKEIIEMLTNSITQLSESIVRRNESKKAGVSATTEV